MIAVTVKHDLGATIKLLDDKHRKQIPFATALALTRTAKLGQKAVREEMRKQFDRPTSFTLRSTFIKPATKRNLQAMVYIKDQSAGGKSRPLSETLGHEFSGGTRERKRLELWLERAGFISSNEFVAPGEAARLDRFGNLSRGQTQQILSQLRAGSDPYAYSSNSPRSKRNVKKAGRMFWSRGGKLPRGVWMRDGLSVKPILIVIATPVYRSRINMSQIIDRVVKQHFEVELRKAIDRAVRTAR